MGRKKLIEDDELIKLIDRYLYEDLHGATSKLTAASISRYLKSQGHTIEPRIISRNKKVMEHIASLKEADPMYVSAARVVVFKPIDLDAVMGMSPRAMRRALAERDRYYSDVSDAAASAINKMKHLEDEMLEWRNSNESLRSQIESAAEKNAELKRALQNSELRVQALKDSLEKYVHPAVATELLKRTGYFSDSTTTIIETDALNEELITADTPIETELTKSLLDAFEEEEQ